MESRLVVEMAGETQGEPLPAVADAPGASSLAGDKHKPHNFAFDHAYWSHDPGDRHFVAQDRVFTDLGQDVVKNAFDGYNVCVFAYGQTGSGKTYTMMGSEHDRGLIPRICESMFLKMAEGTTYKVEVSYLEIYNERVKDLLTKNSSHNLKVREHPSQGPYVQDLSRHLVMEYKDIMRLMEQGNDLRTTASTNMNDTSSRSHAIFTITFVQAGYLSGMPYETESKIHLVDLAGSERANATGASGQRLKEGAHINKSLVTLGSVISALAEAGTKVKVSSSKPSGKGFIPYRDSVLTWLLKDSLGGNSKTIMIATISPADVNHNETLSTLRYANRAKNIINKPTVNEDANVKLIRELREEIDRMRAVMAGDPAMLAAVQEQLAVKEAMETRLTEEWNEKWREAAKILQEHNALGLKRTGLGVVLDSDKPHLIGLDEDILSTGITLYQLKEGETVIGNLDSDEIPHIILKGPSILPRHCWIQLEGGVATLHPAPGSLCLVNAAPIEEPVRLSQGCVIVLGKTNMFRYNDPLEAADLRKSMTEKCRKTSLMNQSLLSQSLSDLRNPNGSKRHSAEFRMFASDSDIKDIQEGSEGSSGGEGPSSMLGAATASQESVTTLKNPNNSGSSTVQTTPRKAGEDENGGGQEKEEEDVIKSGDCASTPSKNLTDINANPHLAQSTPHMEKANAARDLDSVSPVVFSGPETGALFEASRGEAGAVGGAASSMATSSSGESVELSQLYQDICDQKDIIMTCLEEDNCDIDQLNAEIAKLQGMQHKYSLLEFESTKSMWLHQSGDEANFYQEKFAQLIEAEVDRRLEAESELRIERERQERELLLLEKEQELERLRVQHEREIYLMKKKLSTAAAPTARPQPASPALINLSIPRYHTVGSGKAGYVEYEIRVESGAGEGWTLFRRYRQFRDLHTQLVNRYGVPIQSLPFPGRKLFGSKTEAVSSERQRELQHYLNSLISVASKIAACPLHKAHTREALTSFATFFQTNNACQSETR